MKNANKIVFQVCDFNRGLYHFGSYNEAAAIEFARSVNGDRKAPAVQVERCHLIDGVAW